MFSLCQIVCSFHSDAFICLPVIFGFLVLTLLLPSWRVFIGFWTLNWILFLDFWFVTVFWRMRTFTSPLPCTLLSVTVSAKQSSVFPSISLCSLSQWQLLVLGVAILSTLPDPLTCTTGLRHFVFTCTLPLPFCEPHSPVSCPFCFLFPCQSLFYFSLYLNKPLSPWHI